MLLGDFKLEIIVNDNPLHEYNLHDSSPNLRNISNALKSHVLVENERRKEFCEYTTFVAVPEPGTNYKIRFGAFGASESNPIIAVIYIDGNNDGRQYNLLRNLDRDMSRFYNKSFTKMHKFVFDVTSWVETDVHSVVKGHGGLGAISVYFYKAKYVERITQSKKVKLTHEEEDSSNVEIEQTKIPEKKKCIDIAYTTKFDEGEEIISSYSGLNYPSDKNLARKDWEPLAALHINYRPVDWLTVRINKSSSDECKQPFKLDLDDQPELNDILVKSDCKQDNPQDTIIVISDDDSDDVIVSRKRKITEVIELLDSDPE